MSFSPLYIVIYQIILGYVKLHDYNCCIFNIVLERKISMRATKEELIKRGVLLPDYDTIKEETECHSKKSKTFLC